MTCSKYSLVKKIILGGIIYTTKNYWDPNGVLDEFNFDEILSKNLTKQRNSNWFNNLMMQTTDTNLKTY